MFTVLVAAAAGVQACGGTDDAGLSSGGAGGTSGTTDAGAETGGGSGAGTGGSSGGIGGSPDGGADASAGQGGGNTDGFVLCGGKSCPVTTSYCCVTFSLGTAAFDCRPTGVECKGSDVARSECDSRADCGPGSVCCGDFMGLGSSKQYESITCRATGDCGGGDETRMCDPAAVEPCPDGSQCTPSALLGAGYHACSE